MVPQVGLVLKCLLTLGTNRVSLLLMDDSDVAGQTVHSNHLLALRTSQFGFVVHTFHVFPQVEATCELGLAIFLRTGERKILLMNKPLVLLHVCHRYSTL